MRASVIGPRIERRTFAGEASRVITAAISVASIVAARPAVRHSSCARGWHLPPSGRAAPPRWPRSAAGSQSRLLARLPELLDVPLPRHSAASLGGPIPPSRASSPVHLRSKVLTWNENRRLAGGAFGSAIGGRLKRFEPSTFCMASVRPLSLRGAPLRHSRAVSGPSAPSLDRNRIRRDQARSDAYWAHDRLVRPMRDFSAKAIQTSVGHATIEMTFWPVRSPDAGFPRSGPSMPTSKLQSARLRPRPPPQRRDRSRW